MGIILMIVLLRKFSISFPPVRSRLMSPLMTNELDTYAGWILEDMINSFFLLFLLAELLESLVIVSIGMARPVKL